MPSIRRRSETERARSGVLPKRNTLKRKRDNRRRNELCEICTSLKARVYDRVRMLVVMIDWSERAL